MQRNDISDKIFTKNIFINKSKQKRNLTKFNFLVGSKLYERIDLLITGSINIYQTKKEKKYSNITTQ